MLVTSSPIRTHRHVQVREEFTWPKLSFTTVTIIYPNRLYGAPVQGGLRRGGGVSGVSQEVTFGGARIVYPQNVFSMRLLAQVKKPLKGPATRPACLVHVEPPQGLDPLETLFA